MSEVVRRIEYKLYPSAEQVRMLVWTIEWHCQFQNAALQERRDAWRMAKKSISFADQCKSLTIIRADMDAERQALIAAGADWIPPKLDCHSQQLTLKKTERAFQSFFRRVNAGQTPGFPRFKSAARYSSFSYSDTGYKFTPGDNFINGKFAINCIGSMQARGRSRFPFHKVCGCDVIRRANGWYVSLVVKCEPHRERTGDRKAGLDWGVETFATLGYDLDTVETIENPRLFQQEREAIAEAARVLSAKLRKPGKKSKRTMKAKAHLAKRQRKLANRRKDFLHKSSARLVCQHSLIATEALSVKNMTRSAAGTIEEPGRNVAQKAGLNREILDTAPATFLRMLTYKAEEAGCELVILNTRQLKPSQRDPVSWVLAKKGLDERKHVLPCGRVIGRDHAASLVVLRAALENKGHELSLG